MIALTMQNGVTTWVNPDRITFMWMESGGTLIGFGNPTDGGLLVQQQVSTILKFIEET